MRSISSRSWVAVIVAMGPWLVSCALRPFDDPVAVMIDRQAPFRFRRQAAEQAEVDHRTDPRRLAALHQLVWEPGYPSWQRRYAVDQLIRLEPAKFRETLSKRITSLVDQATLRDLFDRALLDHWTDFTPVAITSYARSSPDVPDVDRPERFVIEQLNPGRTIVQTAMDVFANAQRQVTLAQQVAAWELLARLADRPSLIRWLSEQATHDPLVADVKAAAVQLSILPDHREQLLWLRWLRDPTRRDQWHRAVRAVDALSPEQRRGLELRHLAVIVQLDPADRATNRALLLDRICDRLANQSPHPRLDGVIRLGSDGPPPAIQRLPWADLVTIDLLGHSVQDERFIADLFRLADADHRDTTSEHGGIIESGERGLDLHPYAPLLARHDRAYYPTPKMIERLYTSLAHYHFHAQTYTNGRFAKPGRGDLAFANRMNLNCVVATFLDRNRLTVHYYQRGAVVIPLGTVDRPTD